MYYILVSRLLKAEAAETSTATDLVSASGLSVARREVHNEGARRSTGVRGSTEGGSKGLARIQSIRYATVRFATRTNDVRVVFMLMLMVGPGGIHSHQMHGSSNCSAK